MAKQHRDNQYYLERLRDEHPLLYADYKAGKFRNASEAFVAAGLRKPASALKALKSAWSKATPPERDAFKAMIGCTTAPAVSGSTARSGTVSASTRTSAALKGKQQLPPALATQVREIMDRRGLKSGKVMVETGRSPFDPSLGMALSCGSLVQDDLVAELEKWVAQNRAS